MVKRHLSASWIASMVLVSLFLWTHGTTVCRPDSSASNCKKCKCDWSRTVDCDPDDRTCRCVDGFTGERCSEDINECFYYPDICKGFGICTNTIGAYDCVPCQIGFVSYKGSCQPCPDFTYGTYCNETCNCALENSVYCISSTGECICREGWQGEDCAESVDDCLDNDCPSGTCEDKHLHYVCVCGINSMAIGDTCEQYRADIMSLDTKPAIGEWVDIYIFFSMPDKYFKATNLVPKLMFKISDDKSDVECLADFKTQTMAVKGTEPVLSKIGMSTIQLYHVYFHIKRRFFNPGMTTVTAESEGLPKKWKLLFDVRYKNDNAEFCLKDLTIPDTEMNDITKANEKLFKRQSYYVFEAHFQQSAKCVESPRVLWEYYAMHIEGQEDLCLSVNSMERLNTDQLARENKEVPLSDHQQYKEILTKNTLPLGLMMICVTAYIQRSLSTRVMACGFFTVESSYHLEGNIVPSGYYFTATEYYKMSVTANYWEVDTNATLVYNWECLFEIDIYVPKNLKKMCDNGGIKRKYFTFGSNKDISTKKSYKMKLHVSVKDKPEYKLSREVSFRVADSDDTITAYINCIDQCATRVSGKKPVVLEVIGPDYQSCTWTINVHHLDSKWKDRKIHTKYQKRKNKKNIKLSISAPLIKKTGRLPLGHRFVLYCDCKRKYYGYDKYRKARAKYKFETIRAPKGKGCTVSPAKGRAVFTRFNVTCAGYKDMEAGLPLVYRLYQEVTDDTTGEKVRFIVGYSNDGMFPAITLSIENEASEVPLIATITTVFQTSTTFNLKVELTTDDQNDVLEGTLSDRESISKIGSQEELRLVKDVATVMKASATAPTDTKKQVRKQLMKNMKNFEAVAGDSIEHSSSALKELAARDDEVDEDGLSDGLKVANRITKYLGKCGGGDHEIVKSVANFQVSAMNSLVKVSSKVGKGINNASTEEKNRIVQQGREDSMRTMNSMSQITKTLRSGFDDSKDPIKIIEDTIEVVLESQDFAKVETVKMKNENSTVGFSISSKGLNYVGEGSVETEFEFYDKSPYSWTSDRIKGDMPVMKVNFIEPFLGKDADDEEDEDKDDDDKKVERKVWQFNKPADVFLQNRGNTTEEGVDHSTLILVNKYSKTVYMSSCIYLSVIASTEDVTVLEMSNAHSLTFKAKVQYSNSISALEMLTDYDMVDIPLQTPPGVFETTVENRTLQRNSQFIILPKLPKKQYDRAIPFFHVKISVAKGQNFTEDDDLEALPEETLKTLLEKNDLKVNIDALELYNVTVKAIYQKLSCVHFDVKIMDYSYDSCELSVFTSKEELHCRCVVAAAFSASFFVMPRLIDPTSIHLFAHAFDNPLAISVVIFLWLTFMALVIWGRRKDKADMMKRGATVLADNRDHDTYVYLLCVVTGNSSLAGTTSNVYVFLKGTWGKSSVHVLNDTERPLFTNGAENWFVLTTEADLGYLKSAVVWTDHSGGHPSWFLYNIHVQNVQTGEAWNLMFNSWLSATKGAGQIIAEIPATEENIYTEGWFNNILGKGRVDIRNDHLWFGMVFKTAYNKFTRLRRLATALSMLQTLMLVNLMFYGIKNLDDSRQFQYIFGRRIHVTSVIIGFQSCLIMTMVGMGLAGFFNRILPKPQLQRDKSVETLAMEEDFAKQQNAITLNALQTFTSHDISDKRAAYLLKKFREPEIKEEQEETVPVNKPTNDLWFTFPWWCIYIYWAFIVVYNICVSYYVMLYGLSLGYEKSINWVVSFFSGFIFDLIVSQPIKVMGTVVFVVIVYRQTYSLRDMAPFTNLVDASKAVKREKQRSRTYSSTKIQSEYHRPPNTIQIKEILARLHVEITAREMLRDLMLYSVFLTALIAMTYKHTDVQRSYRQTIAVSKMLFHSEFEDGDETNVLDDIESVNDIWSFFNNHLLPFLVKVSDDEIDLNSFYFLGTARIRQVRVERDESGCDDLPLNLIEVYQRERCTLSMSDGKEDTRNFNNSWFEPIDKDDIEEQDDEDEEDKTGSSIYRYKTAEELKTLPIKGEHATYPGGGYTLTLPRHDIAEGIVIIKNLANSGWMDHLTRCLFVEFTMYNPNSKLFTYVVTGFEFDVNGGPYPFKTVSTSQLYHYQGKRKWTEMTEMVVMVCSAFYTVIVGKCLLRVGLAEFFTNFWNWIDIITLGLLCVLAFYIFMRDTALVSVLTVFAQYGNNRFLDFQAVFHKDFTVAVIEGCVGAVGFLKLIYVLRFNPFSQTFMKSADVAKDDTFGFTALTMLFLIGFSMVAVVIFGRHMNGYKDIPHSLLSLLFFIMGEAEYPSLVATNRVMGPAFFIFVMVVTQYVILNFFLSMMRDALDMALSMHYGKKEKTFSYMLDTLKMYFGIGSNRQIRNLDK